MAERDRLADAIHFKLETIKASNGYRDTAEQIAEYLRDKGIETATWERVVELERDLYSAQFTIDTLRLQWQARETRRRNK